MIIDDIASALAAVCTPLSGFAGAAAKTLANLNPAQPSVRETLLARIFDPHVPEVMAGHTGAQIVALHNDLQFDICLHLWVDGFASAHHHAWAGAYQILEGEALHVTYSHQRGEELGTGLRGGIRRIASAERIGPGHTVRVEPGSTMIHGFCYLTPTGLTLSVRSRALADETTTEYLRNGLAARVGPPPARLLDEVKALRYLRVAAPQEHALQLSRLLKRSELLDALWLVRQFPDLDHRLLEAGCRALPNRVRALADARREHETQQYYAGIRERLTNETTRLLAAALYLGLGTAAIRSLAPAIDLPLEVLAILALDGLAEDPEGWQRGLVPVVQAYLTSRNEADTLTTLSESYDIQTPDQRAVVLATCRALRNHPLVGSLFDPNAVRS